MSSNPGTGQERSPGSLRNHLGDPIPGSLQMEFSAVPVAVRKNVLPGRRADEVFHLQRFRFFRSSIFPSASARRSFQNLWSRGMSSPEFRPSSSNSSRRVSRSFSCASRSKVRKYSLTLPYPRDAICCSTNSLRGSGREIVTLGMARRSISILSRLRSILNRYGSYPLRRAAWNGLRPWRALRVPFPQDRFSACNPGVFILDEALRVCIHTIRGHSIHRARMPSNRPASAL
jgi:hypothetical protein